MSAPVAPAPPSPVPPARVQIALRRFVGADVNAFHVALSDPECMKYWSCLPHTKISQTEAWIDRHMNDTRLGRSDERVITDAASGEAMGKVCLQWRSRTDPPEIGILIFPQHWRKGVAKQAMRAILSEAFDEHAARGQSAERESAECLNPPLEVLADVDPRNDASLALMKSFGFVVDRVEERTFQLGDVWVDSVYLRVNEKQFRASHAVGGMPRD